MNFKNIVLAFLCLLSTNLFAQSTTIKGKIFDGQTQEPIAGATVQLISNPQIETTCNAEGQFTITTNSQSDSLKISFIGYTSIVKAASDTMIISLTPNVQELQSVFITANREAGLRTQAPIAISKLSPTLIDETKANQVFEIINKTRVRSKSWGVSYKKSIFTKKKLSKH